MTLGYSRCLFAAGTLDEKLATFLRCHEEGFDHFGGCAHQLIYDNARTVVLSRDVEGRKIQWNPTFWDSAPITVFEPGLTVPTVPKPREKSSPGCATSNDS